MTDPPTVEVSRTWPIPDKKYEHYRVSIRVPVTGEGDGAVLAAARYAAKNAHNAWGEYKAEYENIHQEGGNFQTAKAAVIADQARRQEAEQPTNGPTLESSPPTPAPAGASPLEQAAEAVVAIETSDPSVSEGQLEAIRHHTMQQVPWKATAVKMHLKRSNVAKVEDLSYAEAKMLIGELHSRKG